MNILTLTTDKGFNDINLACYKGLIYKKNKEIKIIEISQNIRSFDLQQASFILSNVWETFPNKTVHHFRVGEETLNGNDFLIFEFREQLFLLPDNGVITMLFPNEQPEKVYRVTNELTTRSNSEFLATIITYIFDSRDFSIIGKLCNDYKELMTQQPISTKNFIRGIIQYIDGYGNLYTNIHISLFNKVREEREFEISLRSISFHDICINYNNISSGDTCVFNERGFLQIIVYQGNASELYNLNVYDSIQIDFKV